MLRRCLIVCISSAGDKLPLGLLEDDFDGELSSRSDLGLQLREVAGERVERGERAPCEQEFLSGTEGRTKGASSGDSERAVVLKVRLGSSQAAAGGSILETGAGRREFNLSDLGTARSSPSSIDKTGSASAKVLWLPS